MLGVPGFEFETVEQVREACLAGRDVQALLSNKIDFDPKDTINISSGIQRIADVPIYFADPLARRSAPLQQTRDAQAPRACMNRNMLAQLGLASGDRVRISQGKGEAELFAELDPGLPDNCVRVAAGHASTAGLGPMFGTVSVGKITAQRAA
jgi:NADH-quinone oxidoreductase subunit G